MSEKRRSGGPAAGIAPAFGGRSFLGHWRADSASDDRDLEIVEASSERQSSRSGVAVAFSFTIARA